MNNIPRSPFATPLSGSAKEVQLRIRNIVQGPKKRPPLWLMALVVSAILSCGWLVSCEPIETPPPDVSGQEEPLAPPPAPVSEAERALLLAKAGLEDFDFLDAPPPTVLLSRTIGSRTLMLIRVEPTPHIAGLEDLVLGLWDGESQALTGAVYSIRGDQGRFSAWETPEGLDLLWANCSVYQGWETSQAPGWFRFDGSTLTPLDALPDTARTNNPDLPADGEFFPAPGEPSGYWDDHKVLPAPGGFELFVRNEEADAGTAPWMVCHWTHAGFLPLTHEAADLRGPIEFLRAHLEQLAHTSGEYACSAIYQVTGLAPLSGYSCVDHPGARAWRFEITSFYDEKFYRVVLTDPDSGTPVGLHSDEEFALTIDGVNYPLGCETTDLFGAPSRTNYIETGLGDGTVAQDFSQWYKSQLTGASGHTYYPETDQYRLNLISTRAPGACTARGIHPGSTVAELFQAYPELDKEYSFPPNCISFCEDAVREGTLEFYLDYPSQQQDLADLESAAIREIVLFAPCWYDARCTVPDN